MYKQARQAFHFLYHEPGKFRQYHIMYIGVFMVILDLIYF